jgi:N-methylhydantoinase B/oxoprolinase/acetone carboxylase alpha subunit
MQSDLFYICAIIDGCLYWLLDNLQVFYKGVDKPVFFVASRGHHADIGGITPGSMPPHSKTIFEEGAVFKSFFLVRDGHFQEKGSSLASNLA